MKFDIVADKLRDEVAPPRSVRSPFTEALLDGKTLRILKTDRAKIGGNSKTLKNHGMRLRSGLISDTEVLVWAEKIEGSNGKLP